MRSADTGNNTGLTISVVTPSDIMPITPDEFKTYAKIDTDADDDIIDDIISAVKDWGQAWTRRTWFTTTLRAEWLTHAREVELPLGPIISITTIETWDGDAWEAVGTDDYEVSGQSDQIITFATWGKRLRVQYVAGYGASATDLPTSLKLGVYKACLSAYEDRQNLASSGFSELPAGTKDYFATERKILF